MLEVDSREDLGKMAGLFKSDASGVARKVRPCSCVVVRSWPKNDELKTHVAMIETQAAQL